MIYNYTTPQNSHCCCSFRSALLGKILPPPAEAFRITEIVSVTQRTALKGTFKKQGDFQFISTSSPVPAIIYYCCYTALAKRLPTARSLVRLNGQSDSDDVLGLHTAHAAIFRILTARTSTCYYVTPYAIMQ